MSHTGPEQAALPIAPARRAPRRAATLLGLSLVGLASPACIGPPPLAPRGPWATAQRIAALDFGRDSLEQRTEHRDLLAHWFTTAAMRPAHWQALPSQLRSEASRIDTLTSDLKRGARHELLRHPDQLPPLLPGARELTQDLVESGDAAVRFLWPEQPLGEIDDARHRTRYDDDHPEASVLQRLLRRLRL